MATAFAEHARHCDRSTRPWRGSRSAAAVQVARSSTLGGRRLPWVVRGQAELMPRWRVLSVAVIARVGEREGPSQAAVSSYSVAAARCNVRNSPSGGWIEPESSAVLMASVSRFWSRLSSPGGGQRCWSPRGRAWCGWNSCRSSVEPWRMPSCTRNHVAHPEGGASQRRRRRDPEHVRGQPEL
ncbi:hypothetical protein VPH35_010654 [Triticum aestivum]